MAMYKNIFVNEEYEGEAGAQVLGVNGEILVFGESAFATLEQATESADVANSIIKVTTGKYDTFYVADANGNVSVADQVVVVEFNGGDDLSYDNGEYSRTVTMEPATFTAEERAQIISALNDNNAASGTVYTTNAQGGNYSTIYVGSTNDFADLGDINGISETIDFGNLIKNDEAFVIVDKNTSVNDVIGSIEHEAGHLTGSAHDKTDGTIKDFLQEETDIRYLNGTTVTEAVDTEHRVMVGSLAKDSTTDVVGTMEKSEVTISADVNTAALWVGARYEDDIVDGKTATLNVTGAGTVVTAGDSELVENDKKIKNEGFIVRSSGIVNVTDGAEINVKWDAQTIIQGAVNVDGEGSKLTYEGSNPLKIYKDNAILTIKNGGELDFDGYEFQVGTSDGKQGKLVIESGATASIDADTDTNYTGFINHQNGLISVDGATLTTNKLVNNGALEIAGATLNAGEVSGAGSFNIGASVDAEGNAIATTLNIGTLNQDVYANKGSADPILLSGSVDSTGNTIRVYGDATISGMKVNAGYTGNVISATGRFCVYGDATITGNTLMYLNAFQTTNAGVIEAGSIINAATYNAYDMGAANDGTVVDARFVIKGELNTVSFIVNNSYYSPSENDELIVAAGGVISANYAAGSGRYSLQNGKVTVYGYAYGNLMAGGGISNIGADGGIMTLTVDGTYAAEGNNNGKFIVTGDQLNWIVEGSELNVINGATYSWGGEVKNDGTINVANSSFSAGTVTNNATINISGNSTIKDTVLSGAGTTLFESGSVTTFEGKNSVTTGIGSTTDFDFVVAEGASLLVTRYVLAYGRDITVNGLIQDATALDSESVKNEILSLKANSTSGFSVSGWGTSVLDVNNAYVDLGNSSMKDAEGSYNWNFKNSYVKADSFAAVNETNIAETAKWDITFDDSRFTTNHTKVGSHVEMDFINGSVAVSNSLKVVGVLSIDSTSSVKISGYQNNKVGALDEHGDITGTVNVAGTLDIDRNAKTAVELFGGEINVNGGTLQLNKHDLVLDADSKVAMNGGSLNSTGTVTNNGTFTVAGESTVNIGTLSGSKDAADIQVLDGATIKDSTIGGAKARMLIMKEATFAGNISIHGINLYGQSEAVLNVAAGATVTVTDFCLRDGSTLNVKGTVNADGISMGGTINVDGGTLIGYAQNYHPDVLPQINISNGGSVTLTNAYKDLSISLDGTSTLTLTGAAYKNFDFDVTGLSGEEGVFKKLVDVKMDSVTVDFSTALSDNENLIVLGNDLYYSTVNTDVLYVNSAYTQPAGTQLADGKIIGFNAFADMQSVVDKFSSYATENQQDLIINVDGLATTSSSDKIFFYTGADVTLTGTADSVIDATSGSRLYFIDTIVPNGSAPSSYDTSDVATVTIAEGLTVKSKRFHLGQTVDTGANGDVDGNGNLTRDAGAIHMIINGNVNCSNYTIASGSSMTINETGTFVAYSGGDDHLRAGSSLIVNGGGKYSSDNLQFQSNWVANRGGDMTFNDTFIKVATVKLLPDESNAAVSGDTVATFNLNNSTAEVHAFEISADSSLNVKNSNLIVETSITNNGTVNITDNSTLTANSISGSGKINIGKNEEERSTINLGSATADAELTISADKILIANTDMSLLSDVAFNSTNYPVFGNGSIDMNGKTMTISSTGLACIGNGAGGLTLKDGFVVANTNHFCMQCQGNVISADVELTVNGVGRTTSMFNTYGTTAIYGKVNVNHSIWGYDNIGSNAAGFEEPANELLISGANASLNITRTDVSEGELRFTVTGGAAAGKLYVEDGASFKLTNGRVENENLISVSNGAKFAADKLVNTGSVTIVDAAFTAGIVDNKGSFYANANSTVTVTGNFTSTTDLTFNGNVTIGGTLTVNNLTLAAGSDVTVNNLVVNTELNLILGAALTITTAKLGNFNLTVNGNITASEYELVKGWKGEYDKEITFNGKKYTLDEAKGIYSNENDASLSFQINEDGTLILKDKAAQAAAGSVLIDPNLDLADGESIVIGGIRYTEGVNAFKSEADIRADKVITGVVLNNADVDAALNDDALANVQTVTIQGADNTIDSTVKGEGDYTLNVEAGSELIGSTGKFDVTGDMTINNDGHLDTNATASGAMTIVNTSANTLKGTYTATDLKIDNQVSGAIVGATLNGTVSTAISGGTGTGVTVNTPHLSLNNTKFEIVGGSILSTVTTENGGEADTGITLTGDTDLTISKAGEISTTIREAADNVGTTTLTTVDTQTYTGDIEVDKIIIGNGVNTTLNGTVDFSDLELDGTLSIDMTSGNNYTGAGSVNGEGTLNLSHDGAWIVNDTVNRDFSGFTGTVNMTDADAQIVLGLGDAPNSTADSYFADGTTVNVAAGQEVFLAANAKNTAIEFGEDGAINVGNLSVRVIDGGTATLANNSNDFTQTLSGDNSAFTGTVNMSEGAQLTIANKLGATAINMDVEVADTGDTDDTQLNLAYEGLELAAKITGDTNDMINVTESATLKAAGAIDAFSGKVNVTDNETLTLAGVNSTAAIFNGSDTTTLELDANTTLTADKALNGFSGTVDMTQDTEEATSLTLNGENTTAATFVGSTSDAINANADTTLTADKALNGFSGTVVMADNVVVTLNGKNTTAAKFNGDTTNTLDVNADTTLTADGAITDFSGTVDMIQDTEAATTLTISGANTTAATFKGAEGDVINVGTAGNTNTFSAAGAVNAFEGTINVAEGATLTLNGGNTTDAAINLGIEEVPNVTTLNLANTNVLNGAITGDTDDVINVNGGKTTLNADNTGFTGIINLNGPSYTELVLNDDLSQADKGQINFNVNGAFLTSSGADVTIGSILVSGEGIVDEKFDVWGSKTTLSATGALDKFDGEVRIAETSNGVGTLTLLGDNTTAAKFVSINTNKKVEVVLNGADLTLKGDGALNDFWGKIQVADNTLTLDAENTTTALLYGNNDAKFVVNSKTVLVGDQGNNLSPYITGNNAISNFAGTITIANGADLFVNSNNTTYSKFDGNGTAHFAGGSTNTLESDGALNNFTGKIDLSTDYKGTSTKDTLVLNGENTTSATFVAYSNDKLIVNADTTLTGEGALNKFSGTINMTQDTETAQVLTLTQENTTAATLIGSADDKLVVNADNTFTHNVSGFAGLYDIAANAELTLSDTFSNTIRANGGTLTLSGNAKNNATTTVTAESALNTLNIDDNDVTLATGDFSNVYGEAGSKLSFTADFNDTALVDVKVGTVYITDTKDIVVEDEFAANVDMTIDTVGATNTVADLTLSGAAANIAIGDVVVNNAGNIALSGKGAQNYYYLITGTGDAVSSDVESITIDGMTLAVGSSTLHTDGYRYFLNIKEDGAMEHLVITRKAGYSNYVTVNAAWADKVTGAEVTDAAGIVRNMNYDAAANMDAAIDSIRGDQNWNITTQEGGTAKGQAQIELDVTGDYAITDGKYLMDADNGVTDLLLNGREGVNAVITSDIYGSDGNRVYKSSADEAGQEAVTSLTLKNVTTYGNIYGGGKLTIDNSMNANAWISGSTVAAGTNGVSTNHDTELVLAGGNFTTTFLTGGSWAYADSMTAADSKIVIKGGVSATGTILGGGYATDGKTLTQGDATVVIDANGKISLAGTIYAAGGAATGGTLNVGNREVIFTGSSDNLAFTGTVSGKGQGKGTINYNGSATVTFDDWSGVFKGSLTEFDTMVISGDTTLELARRQNKTGNTTLTFDVGGRTNTSDAMYTVRDANRWEFATTITVDVTAVTNTGSYTLIDNFGAVGNLNYVDVNGTEITIGTEFNTAYGKATLSVVDDSLKMTFTAADPDTVTMDVDAVLNSTKNVSAVEITGITDLKTDVAGAKTIIGSVDNVLASAKIDNVDAVLGSATKIFDASTTADTTDTDVWASLTKNSDGSLTVAWGRSEAEVGAALDAFNTNKSSLALGESLVADASGLADGDYKDCFQLDDKKSNGTLA